MRTFSFNYLKKKSFHVLVCRNPYAIISNHQWPKYDGKIEKLLLLKGGVVYVVGRWREGESYEHSADDLFRSLEVCFGNISSLW